ncbi:MAG: zinc ribbon domain-containing protein [Actinomycetota bacterium]
MPMEVDAPALQRLLQVQAEDTAIKRLEERKASFPEAARLEEVTGNLAELDADLEIARKQNDELKREQDRLEGEIEILAGKTEREQQRLYSGAVSNPKELDALRAEVEMLKRQRADLEDKLLEVMVQKDQAAAQLESLESERAEAAKVVKELGATVASILAEIDKELEGHRTERDKIAAVLPGDLLTLYEGLRDAKGGVGAAALEGGTCQGCHTTLPAREVERLRAERGLQRCDNCRRILVVV